MNKMEEQGWRLLQFDGGQKIVRVDITADGYGIRYLTTPNYDDQRIERVEIIDDGYGIKYYTAPKSKSEGYNKEFEKMFPIVDIENISLEDRFMQYEPSTYREKRVKAQIIVAKEIGVKNFRKPCMDPSFAVDGHTVIYCAGRKPAVGESPYWWDENAPKFMPKKNSRLINSLEKYVFLGILIKELVDFGYKVEEAWRVVCRDSSSIGHYKNSPNSQDRFDYTGSRRIGRWYDLGNTCKIVKSGLGFQIFGGGYGNSGIHDPLADAEEICWPRSDCYHAVGEIVIDV